MEEELEHLWEGFTPTEEEQKELKFTEVEIRRANIRGQNCLILLILIDKNMKKEAFKAAMTKIWNPEGWLFFKEVGHNKFIVDQFQKRMDMERVLNGRPWFFDKSLICIQQFDSNTPPNEMNFNQEPFWV